MPKIVKQQVNCPNCKNNISVKLWTSINPQLAPSIRSKIMDETLFDFFCPECKYKSKLEYPFIYNDMKNNFIIYFIPYAKKNRIDFTVAQKEYPQLNSKVKRLVKNLNHMKEKIIIFENGLNDLGIEFTKYYLERFILKKINKHVSSSYFCMLDTENRKLGFSFFLEDRDEPLYHTTTLDVYEKHMNILNKSKVFDESKVGFVTIDQNWVASVLLKK